MVCVSTNTNCRLSPKYENFFNDDLKKKIFITYFTVVFVSWHHSVGNTEMDRLQVETECEVWLVTLTKIDQIQALVLSNVFFNDFNCNDLLQDFLKGTMDCHLE